MNSTNVAGGAVPVSSVLDYLLPEINRPDIFEQEAYPLRGGGGSSRAIMNAQKNIYSIQKHDKLGNQRSPFYSLFYTIGLIILSAAIFISLSAWANVLLSWYDSIYVNSSIDNVTRARIYFATTISIISIIIIIILIMLWYYFTIIKSY